MEEVTTVDFGAQLRSKLNYMRNKFDSILKDLADNSQYIVFSISEVRQYDEQGNLTDKTEFEVKRTKNSASSFLKTMLGPNGDNYYLFPNARIGVKGETLYKAIIKIIGSNNYPEIFFEGDLPVVVIPKRDEKILEMLYSQELEAKEQTKRITMSTSPFIIDTLIDQFTLAIELLTEGDREKRKADESKRRRTRKTKVFESRSDRYIKIHDAAMAKLSDVGASLNPDDKSFIGKLIKSKDERFEIPVYRRSYNTKTGNYNYSETKKIFSSSSRSHDGCYQYIYINGARYPPLFIKAKGDQNYDNFADELLRNNNVLEKLGLKDKDVAEYKRLLSVCHAKWRDLKKQKPKSKVTKGAPTIEDLKLESQARGREESGEEAGPTSQARGREEPEEEEVEPETSQTRGGEVRVGTLAGPQPSGSTIVKRRTPTPTVQSTPPRKIPTSSSRGRGGARGRARARGKLPSARLGSFSGQSGQT